MRTLLTARQQRALILVALGLVVLPGARCGNDSTPNLPPAQVSAVGDPTTETVQAGTGATINNSGDYAPTSVTECLRQRINNYRLSNSLNAVAWDQVAAGVAVLHTNDMVVRDYFSLVNPEGVDLFTSLISSNPPSTATAAQYFIVQGTCDPNELWNFIINDASTLAAIEDAQWRFVGIGYNPGDGGVWTILFTN